MSGCADVTSLNREMLHREGARVDFDAKAQRRKGGRIQPRTCRDGREHGGWTPMDTDEGDAMHEGKRTLPLCPPPAIRLRQGYGGQGGRERKSFATSYPGWRSVLADCQQLAYPGLFSSTRFGVVILSRFARSVGGLKGGHFGIAEPAAAAKIRINPSTPILICILA
jgi:hypothetical protein